jgi:hypothetical protein
MYAAKCYATAFKEDSIAMPSAQETAAAGTLQALKARNWYISLCCYCSTYKVKSLTANRAKDQAAQTMVWRTQSENECEDGY